jgi:hypothetical protein
MAGTGHPTLTKNIEIPAAMSRRNPQPQIALMMNNDYGLKLKNSLLYHGELILALDLLLPISCEAMKQDQR